MRMMAKESPDKYITSVLNQLHQSTCIRDDAQGYSLMAIRSAFLLHGIALLSCLLLSLFKGFLLFGVGILLTAFSAILFYLATTSLSRVIESNAHLARLHIELSFGKIENPEKIQQQIQELEVNKIRMDKKIRYQFLMALSGIILSYLVFIIGLYCILTQVT